MSRRTLDGSIAALTHGRYVVEAPATETAAPLLVGFHGYGENAEHHLEQLRRIPGAERWILCAVAALHPFYKRTGEVVRCWMTNEDRELAIEDNVRYTASVVTAVRRRLATLETLVFAGFSQGVAMAYRAAAAGGHPCHGLLVLAGDVPPDVAARPLPGFPPVLLGRGTKDDWYTEEKMAGDLEVLRRRRVEVESCVFDGGHEWGAELLERAGELLARVAASSAVPAGADRR